MMDSVWVSEVPCNKSTHDTRYRSWVPVHIEYEEMLIMCSIWDLARSCGMKARIDGGPYKDCRDSRFGGPKDH